MTEIDIHDLFVEKQKHIKRIAEIGESIVELEQLKKDVEALDRVISMMQSGDLPKTITPTPNE